MSSRLALRAESPDADYRALPHQTLQVVCYVSQRIVSTCSKRSASKRLMPRTKKRTANLGEPLMPLSLPSVLLTAPGTTGFFLKKSPSTEPDAGIMAVGRVS